MRNFSDVMTQRARISSRRREPRLDAGGTVSARHAEPGEPTVLAVYDVGFRGFAIETAEPVTPGRRTRFEFSSAAGPLFVADAVSVHCHQSIRNANCFVSGWEFPDQPGLDDEIERLIDAVLGEFFIAGADGA